MIGARALIRDISIAVVSVLAAHALAYALVRFLPDPAVLLLGIFSAQEHALESVRAGTEMATYPVVLGRLLTGDLGRTLDGTAVASELAVAISYSLPRVFLVLLAIFVCAGVQVLWGRAHRERAASLPDFIIFVPAFVFPLAAISLLLIANPWITPAPGGALMQSACVVSMAVGPCSLVLLQARSIMNDNLSSQYAARLRASGAVERTVRLRLLRNAAYEMMPSLEKLVGATLTFLVFAEYVFNFPGLGTQTIRAVSRADWALILGIVLVFAITVNASRVVSQLVRRQMAGR